MPAEPGLPSTPFSAEDIPLGDSQEFDVGEYTNILVALDGLKSDQGSFFTVKAANVALIDTPSGDAEDGVNAIIGALIVAGLMEAAP